MRFSFVLGFNEELSLLELESVLGKKTEKTAPSTYEVDLPDIGSAIKIAVRLGGLVELYSVDEKRRLWRFSAKEWIKRDRNKPYQDKKKGLLPPKIARILVNLAVGDRQIEDKTLLDPFCGSGTVLMEAALIGLHPIGNDLDEAQVSGAQANLKWLNVDASFHRADAVSLSKLIQGPVDFIVTEPYMGRVTARPDRRPDLAKGLGKLYLGCLKDWSKFLAPGGRIAMVFPVFEYQNKEYRTSSILDDKHLLDYNIEARGLMYFRPGAEVKREIVILAKTRN